MLDCARHMTTVENIKKLIDAAALVKMNTMHWHLPDDQGRRVEIDSHPELITVGSRRRSSDFGQYHFAEEYSGYFTKDEIREVVAYADDNYIEVIPEFDMPGHTLSVLAAYPELSCKGKPLEVGTQQGIFDDILCAGNDDSLKLVFDVLGEMIELFPGRYFHIGGDEAAKNSWEKCPKCQARIRKEGLKDEKELQSYLIHRIEKFLNDHGRKLIGWDEILEGGLAPSATVMSWRGEQGGITAAKAEHDVFMTPGESCYLDAEQDAPATQPEAIGGYLTLAKVYSYDPVPAELTDAQKTFIKGVQANVWTEYIPTEEHAEYMIYPRLLALAEVAWTAPEHKDWPRFRQAALKEVQWLQSQGYHPFDLSKEVGERPESLQPVEHLGLHCHVTYAQTWSSAYPASGDSTLTDGVRGGWTYGDKRWQGFLCKDVDVTIDLGKVTDVKLVEADFLQLRGPEVWLPKEVVISLSEDGQTFTEMKRIATDVAVTEERLTFRNYRWEGNAKARYVHFQGLLNREVMGWMFTDEIVIK